MNEHTLKRFEDELNLLSEKTLAMGGLVEKAVRRSMKALVNYDQKKANKVIERDQAINALEVEIDDMTRSMLALRQPAAGDLRLIIATIKIVTDLERCGDMAEGIAEFALMIHEHPHIQLDSLEVLADRSLDQLKEALNAFASNDMEAALSTIEKDKRINKQYKAIERENLTYMLEDPRYISSGMMVAAIAKNLERIADHAVNISEMAIYKMKGHDVRHVDHQTAAALVSGALRDED